MAGTGFKVADAYTHLAVTGEAETYAALEKVEKKATSVGLKLDKLDGKKISVHASVSVNNLSQAAFDKATAGLKIKASIDPGSTPIKLRAIIEQAPGTVTKINGVGGAGGGGSSGGGGGGLAQGISFDPISFDSPTLIAKFKGVTSAIGNLVQISAGATALGGLTAALGAGASAAAALTSALVALSGVAGLLPGVLGGLGAIVGTIAIGMRGITDAISAGVDASDAAAKGSSTAAAAAKTTASALNQQKTAHQALTTAQQAQRKAVISLGEAYEAARDRIAGYSLALRGAALDVKGTKDALTDAKKTLKKLIANPDASDDEIRRAADDVDRAQLGYDSARADQKSLKKTVRKSNREGVEGSPEVRAAKDSLATAQQSVEAAKAALATAQDSATAAVAGITATQNKATDALNQLSVEGQKFAKAMTAIITGPFEKLKDLVQDGLLGGLDTAVTNAADKIFPTLEKGMVPLSKSLNLVAKDFLSFISTPETQASILSIFDSITKAVEVARPSLGVLAKVLLTLTDASAKFLPALAKSFGEVVGKVSAFLDKALKDGSFDDFVNNGLKALGALSTILGTVAGLITGLANGNKGVSVLDTIATVLDQVAAFFEKKETQTAIGGFVTVLTTAFSAIFTGLGPEFMTTLTTLGTVLGGLATAAAPVINLFIHEFMSAFNKSGPALLTGLASLATIFGQLAVNALPALVPLIKGLAGGLLEIATSDLGKEIGKGLLDLVTGLAPLIPDVVAALLTLVPQIPLLVKAMLELVPIIPPLVAAFVALVPPLVDLALNILPVLVPLLVRALDFSAAHPKVIIAVAAAFLALSFALKGLKLAQAIMDGGATALKIGKFGVATSKQVIGLGPKISRGFFVARRAIASAATDFAAGFKNGFAAASSATGKFGTLGGKVASLGSAISGGFGTLATRLAPAFATLRTFMTTSLLGVPVIGWILLGAAAAALIYVYRKQIADFLGKVFGAVFDFFKKIEFKAIGRALLDGLFYPFQHPLKWLGMIKDFVVGIVDWVKHLFGVKSPSTVFKKIGGYLIEGLIAGIRAYIGLYKKAFGFLFDVVRGLGGRLLSAAGNVWGWIVSKAKAAFRLVVTVVGKEIAAYAKLGGLIRNAVGDLWGFIKTGIRGAIRYVGDKFDEVVTTLTGMKDRVATAAVGAFDGLKDAFKSAINFIIDAWNNLSFKLPSVDTHIPGVGKVGGFELSTPDIKPLAKGGTVKARPGGLLALVAEAGRDERVTPLTADGLSPFEAALYRELRSSRQNLAGSTTTHGPVDNSSAVVVNVTVQYGDVRDAGRAQAAGRVIGTEAAARLRSAVPIRRG